MSSTKVTIRRLACSSGLALTVVAFGGGAAADAGAKGEKAVVCTTRAQACLTDAEFRALTIRSVALNRKYGVGE